MAKTNLMSDLDKLVKRAAAAKVDALKKTASPGDGVPDGTSPATTGAQAAANLAADKEQSVAVAVSTGAKDNQPGKSLEAQKTDGATAVAADGQAGAKGAVLSPTETKPQTEGQDKLSADKALVAELRKAAEEAAAPAAVEATPNTKEQPRHVEPGIKGNTQVATDKDAPAPKAQTEVAPTIQGEASAPASKTAGIRGFLAKAAMMNPQIKTAAAAQGMDEGAVGDAAAAELMQRIESGQLSEEEANAILEEAIQSGAISEQDLVEALSDHPEAGGAPQGAPQGMPQGAEMAPEEMKIAAALVGPEHPQYLAKLAQAYGQYADAGYALCMKLAEELVEDDAKHEATETPAEEKKEEAEEKKEEEAAAPAAAPEAAAAAAPAPAPEAVAAPAAEAAVDPALVAATPEEQAALAQAQQELGLSDQDMAAIAAAPAPKVASAKDRFKAAILNKVASLSKTK